jgi:hypothetical protein
MQSDSCLIERRAVPSRLLQKEVVASDHTAIGIPCNVVTHADGQRLGREPAAFLLNANRVFRDKWGNLMTHEEFTRMASNLAARDKGVPTDKARDQAQGTGVARTDPPGSAKSCDFCADSNGATVYRASDFEKDLITPGSRPSEASWAACGRAPP